jgi:sugar-specific transcriptional regulator TrmB
MTDNEISTLMHLGLTPNEARCYLILLKAGSASVNQVATTMGTLPNAVYRLLDKLTLNKMAVALSTTPRKYQAVPVKAALEAVAQKRVEAIEEAKLQALSALGRSNPQNDTKVDFVVGRKEFFDVYVKLAAEARREILVIAIGDPVPEEITLSNRDAIQRGIDLKLMFHRYDKGNVDFVRSWAAMGASVAHFPDSGFHLNVFDGERAILLATNPKEHSERTGMVITSQGLAQALREFFYTRWEKAVPVTMARGASIN